MILIPISTSFILIQKLFQLGEIKGKSCKWNFRTFQIFHKGGRYIYGFRHCQTALQDVLVIRVLFVSLAYMSFCMICYRIKNNGIIRNEQKYISSGTNDNQRIKRELQIMWVLMNCFLKRASDVHQNMASVIVSRSFHTRPNPGTVKCSNLWSLPLKHYFFDCFANLVIVQTFQFFSILGPTPN